MPSAFRLGEGEGPSSGEGESYGKVGVNARLLDGYSERHGRSFIDGREVEVRYFDNA